MESMVRVTRGVWRPATQVADLFGRVAAMLTACPEHTVVSGVTAARLHGMWLPPELARLDQPIEVILHRDVARLERRPRSRRREVRGRRQLLAEDEVDWLDGIPVTSEARTWLALASRLTTADLVALGDSALRGRATREQLDEVVRRSAGRPGVVRARAVLPLLDARSRSRPESHMRYALLSHGLPAPAVNLPVFTDTHEWLAEPDLSYDDVRLAIEYNGRYHADVDRMRRDLDREDDVDMRGDWRVVTFGPRQVFGRPDQLAARVRKLRRERATRPVDPWAR